MTGDLGKVLGWAKQAPEPESISRWPGAATRIPSGLRKNEIDFRRGDVIHVTDLSISVEMDHPVHRLVKLMGDSYAHYCRNCQKTIPGNVSYRRSADAVLHDGQYVPIRFFCPYCGPGNMLRMLVKGDKLRLHHRFDHEHTPPQWAGWYAEVWRW